MKPQSLREVLAGPVLKVAPQLLGMRLLSLVDGQPTELVVTEVEAYAGSADPASHAYRGPTARNRSMFAGAGTLYVYRSYGLHWCANVVTGGPGSGCAVLLRAGVPSRGLEVMRRRRGRDDHLADGPGKLCQALAISGSHDGEDLLGEGPVRLLAGHGGVPYRTTPRVGITRAVDLPWRFVADYPSPAVGNLPPPLHPEGARDRS